MAENLALTFSSTCPLSIKEAFLALLSLCRFTLNYALRDSAFHKSNPCSLRPGPLVPWLPTEFGQPGAMAGDRRKGEIPPVPRMLKAGCVSRDLSHSQTTPSRRPVCPQIPETTWSPRPFRLRCLEPHSCYIQSTAPPRMVFLHPYL